MSTALYRRYRPETFAEVIGQEHVTDPLSTALRNDRINHAYLFSGPRGCGKTTSARILARCLNCEQGPTPTPCGVCDSCVALARGGPGSLDVVEIDAASHGGVDDARDLRERAAFAPARDRYKVFIIDEAHMVSSQGFNALLKLVEEPPAHVRFIFATTEPEKVIGTIRSRTHHYPFRLVPPERLTTYLGELCEQEGVPVGTGVLPLVVRAGAGSVRDSLSVLDQLIGGSGPEGLDYARAVSLLGFTDATLLDDVVEALSAGDGATVFTVVDRVVQTGHDPRRFVEDLLERLRDLLVLTAVRDRASAVLRGLPEDQLTRMENQAARFGAGELSRAADVVNAALTEMTGATSPRLQLELLMARLLLPDAEDAERGVRARLDRLEKRVGVAGPAAESPRVAAPSAPGADPAPEPVRNAPAGASSPPAPTPVPGEGGMSPAEAARQAAREARSGRGRPEDAPESPAPAAAPSAAAPAGDGGWGEPVDEPSPAASAPAPAPAPPAPPAAAPAAQQASAAPGALDTETVRRRWEEVLEALKNTKRATWSLISQHAQVLEFSGNRLVLGFGSSGLAGAYSRGAHKEFLRQALIEVLGLDCQIDAVVGDSPPPPRGGNGGGAPAPAPSSPAASSPAATVPAAAPPAAAPPAAPAEAPTSSAAQPTPPAPEPAPRAVDLTPPAGPAPTAGRGATSWEPEAPRSVDLTAAEDRAAVPAAVRTEPRAEQRAEPESRRRPNVTTAPPDIPLPDEPPMDEDEAPFPDTRGGGGRMPSRVPPSTPPAARATPPAPAQPGGTSDPAPAGRAGGASGAAQARAAAFQARASQAQAAQAARGQVERPAETKPVEDEPSRDDVDIEGSDLVGAAVVEQLLGGRVIEERTELP